jgi:hypothetical protein
MIVPMAKSSDCATTVLLAPAMGAAFATPLLFVLVLKFVLHPVKRSDAKMRISTEVYLVVTFFFTKSVQILSALHIEHFYIYIPNICIKYSLINKKL